eukprot:COSAG02_NODE_16676_length_1064_cov_2.556477_2_plen_169_part_00
MYLYPGIHPIWPCARCHAGHNRSSRSSPGHTWHEHYIPWVREAPGKVSRAHVHALAREWPTTGRLGPGYRALSAAHDHIAYRLRKHHCLHSKTPMPATTKTPMPTHENPIACTPDVAAAQLTTGIRPYARCHMYDYIFVMHLPRRACSSLRLWRRTAIASSTTRAKAA